ncbi:BUD13 homolog isoform X2 [Gadus morhua]|uniref:BUD13 homolog isoform X2 n=1 Tax=Gadus morhua TaxID=8049 RepID=UPI0011B3B05B|nr:BUD13 homolog isoform X2 [Gadus morhua]
MYNTITSSMTPSWSVVVMWLLVGFVSGGPLTSLDLDNGPSFDPHDGNSTERNGNYTESPEDPAPPSFDPHDGNSTERNGNYTESPEDPAPPSFDRHDGNSTERNGNYTESPEDPAPVFLNTPGIGWPTRGVHSKPPSGDLIAGMMTMHYNSPEDPAPPSFDRHDGNSTERNGNYTESPEDPAPVFLNTPGIGWPTRGVHPKPASGDLIAGETTMDYYGNGKK